MATALARQGQIERPSDITEGLAPGEDGDFLRWKAELDHAITHFKDYHKRVDSIMKRYRAEQEVSSNRRRYNILWSIVSTLQPNLFVAMPKPHVERRYNDNDPVSRAASQVLERVLSYANDSDDMNDAFAAATDDYILAARGTVWSRYAAEFDLRHSEKRTPYADGDDIPEGSDTGTNKDGSKYYRAPMEVKTDEECETDHISVTDFLHSPASKWKTVPWTSKRVLMTRDELVERFKQKGEKVPLNYYSDGTRVKKTRSGEEDQLLKVAAIWEVWDKVGRNVYWLCLDDNKILDKRKDVLKLKNFYPCPRPLYDTTTNDTLIPVPMFKYFEDVANELDEITFRISLLTEAIRVVGIYDAQLGDIMKQVTETNRDNKMIGVENWSAVSEGGGMKKLMEFLPVEQIILVLEKLYEARVKLLAELYEITGISDIIRGSTDPRETAKAQSIKGQYASKRLQRKQRAVARFAREHLEIQAEIICSQYDAEKIREISSAEQLLRTPDGAFDQQLFDAAIKLLRNKPLRCFRIKIDNETLAGDQMKENQEQVNQFITGLSGMIQGLFPLARESKGLAYAIKETAMLGIRAFPVARSVEGAFLSAFDEMIKNMPPPEAANENKGMSPEEMKIKMRELDIREQELGVKRNEFILKDWETRENIALQKRKLADDARLRELQIKTVRENAAETNTVKDKVATEDRQADIHKHQSTLTQQANDNAADRDLDKEKTVATLTTQQRQHDDKTALAERQHEDGHSLEMGRTAAEIAERKLDRETSQEDAAETRAHASSEAEANRKQADKHHGDQMKATREANEMKAKQAAQKGKDK